MAFNRNDDVLNRYLYDLYKTDYSCLYHLPSDFKERLSFYKRSTFSFFGCYDYNLYFYSSNNSFDNGAYAELIKYNVKDNSFTLNSIFLPNSEVLSSFQEYVISYPNSSVFDGSNNFQSVFLTRVNVNNDIYDDLKNSSQPSEIIFSMLYCLIPVLLFLIGFKVLRKGLFK